MTRRILNTTCGFAAASWGILTIVAYLYPNYHGRVWGNGVWWVQVGPAGIGGFYEDRRRDWTEPAVWRHTSRSLFLAGISWNSAGVRRIWVPGGDIEWCRQPTGYRRWSAGACPFILAWLCLVPPAAVVVVTRTRRFPRRHRGGCVKCGYDLRNNVSGVCPECGFTYRAVPTR